MHTDLTVEKIQTMSYTDFVGLINQWNVLPGSYSTLSKWAMYSQMNADSQILEVACTTGFSSRELAVLTGCRGEAFDLSQISVERAQYNLQKYAPGASIDYKVADGYEYTTDKRFSHVIFGASLGFFPDPEKMLSHVLTFMNDGGYILASPFYVTETIPSELVEKARGVFGITVTQAGYKEIMDRYKKLEILYEDRNELVQETDEEIRYYCDCTIKRAAEMLEIDDTSILEAMHERLFTIKKMSNDLRPYQRYSVLVLRYRKSVYPNRFVELF